VQVSRAPIDGDEERAMNYDAQDPGVFVLLTMNFVYPGPDTFDIV
jgi:hypothetical protein